MPSNAAALYVQYSSSPFGTTKPGMPRLTTRDGAPIPFTIDGPLIRPTSPLPLGDAILRFDEPCTYPPDAGLPEITINFKVTSVAPVPTKLGTIAATHARTSVTVGSYAGTCTDRIDAAVAKLTFTLDPALESYRSVLALRTDVDGKYWGASVFGRDNPSPYEVVAGGGGMESGLHRHDLVFAACGPSPNGVIDRGVAVGKHKVEVTAMVAGAEPLPAVAYDIELTCGGEPGLPETGTADDSGTTTTEAGPVSIPADAATDTSRGCGFSTERGPSAMVALVLVALALLRRLESARRCPSPTTRGPRADARDPG